jgi:hypothetical protein
LALQWYNTFRLGLLSETIKKYYTRDGNRLVFSEKGFSLNRLAWEMNERLDYKEIDPSVVSRVLSGERLFTLKQLKVFCSVINITGSNFQKLYEALIYDFEKRYGFNIINKSSTSLISLTESAVEHIKVLRIQNNPEQAIDWSQQVNSQILKLIDKTANISYRRKLLNLLANSLHEKLHAVCETVSPKLMFNYVKEFLSKFYFLANELKSTHILGMYYLTSGNLWYFNRQYQLAQDYLEKAVDFLNPDSDEHLIAVRNFGMCAAETHNASGFNDARHVLLKNLNLYPKDRYCTIFESLARGSSILKNSKEAFLDLNKARSYYEKINSKLNIQKILYQIQFSRTDLEIANNLSTSSQYKQEIAVNAQNGYRLCQLHNYSRYGEGIKNLYYSLFHSALVI